MPHFILQHTFNKYLSVSYTSIIGCIFKTIIVITYVLYCIYQILCWCFVQLGAYEDDMNQLCSYSGRAGSLDGAFMDINVKQASMISQWWQLPLRPLGTAMALDLETLSVNLYLFECSFAALYFQTFETFWTYWCRRPSAVLVGAFICLKKRYEH